MVVGHDVTVCGNNHAGSSAPTLLCRRAAPALLGNTEKFEKRIVLPLGNFDLLNHLDIHDGLDSILGSIRKIRILLGLIRSEMGSRLRKGVVRHCPALRRNNMRAVLFGRR